MRICSFVPGATEMVAALGLERCLVGRSHECDYPPTVTSVPVLVRPYLDSHTASSAEIDRSIRTSIQTRRPLYEIDIKGLAAASPDVIIAQEGCDVCAVTPGQLATACTGLAVRPQILTVTDSTLEGIFCDIARLGTLVHREAEAEALVSRLRTRLNKVREETSLRTEKPRVACLEWLDPLYAAGHWVPEMVDFAGGKDVFAQPGVPSRRITRNDLVETQPDVLVVMPCGFSLVRAVSEFCDNPRELPWHELPAVRTGRVFALDAHAYSSRSGPRLVDGVERLAAICARPPREVLPEGVQHISNSTIGAIHSHP